MPRHAHSPLRGQQDQRDRGRRKKHHKSLKQVSNDLRERTTVENWEAKLQFFERWLKQQARTNSQMAADQVSSMPLTKFLQLTPTIDISADERLRQLAIFLEADCEAMPQPKGWHILRRIYREALKYDAEWPWLYHSMALSATCCAEALKVDDPLRHKMYEEAVGLCRIGIAVNDGISPLFSMLGRSLYELRELHEAITAYDRAIELNGRNMWAVLYRAHCYHDLKNWPEAVSAYEAVDLSFFDGPKSWRAVLVRDQLAACKMHSGDLDGALADFEAALHRYETNPGSLWTKQYLEEAAEGPLREQLAQRVKALKHVC